MSSNAPLLHAVMRLSQPQSRNRARLFGDCFSESGLAIPGETCRNSWSNQDRRNRKWHAILPTELGQYHRSLHNMGLVFLEGPTVAGDGEFQRFETRTETHNVDKQGHVQTT
jgi:hypothetical protein